MAAVDPCSNTSQWPLHDVVCQIWDHPPYNLSYVPYLSEMEDVLVTKGYQFVFSRMVQQGWWLSCLPIGALYVVCIFTLQKWMKSRKPFDLRGPLVLWNILLAAFSFVGTWRTVPELWHVYTQQGVHGAICTAGSSVGVSAVYAALFSLSKLPELFDTVFIVLRKKPLIFLHWYHHLATLCTAWFSIPNNNAYVRLFIVMNFTIHTVMYSYFAAKGLRLKVPKFLSMSITVLQLSQMAVGVYAGGYAWHSRITQGVAGCQVTYISLTLMTVMYTSYFVLFAAFFHSAYLAGRTRLTRPVKNGLHNLLKNNSESFKKID